MHTTSTMSEAADPEGGDAVNVAARRQAAASSNGVAVGELTHELTARDIECEELPPVAAKGKAEPGIGKSRLVLDFARRRSRVRLPRWSSLHSRTPGGSSARDYRGAPSYTTSADALPTRRPTTATHSQARFMDSVSDCARGRAAGGAEHEVGCWRLCFVEGEGILTTLVTCAGAVEHRRRD